MPGTSHGARRPELAPGSVFFLTDYGRSDELVGVVHAVLLRLAPGVPVVDLTHDLVPFSVRAGALALARAAPYLGPGVVLGVVDPGVGSARRPIAIEVRGETGPRYWVGPDNGLLLDGATVLGGPVAAVELERTGAAGGGDGPVTFDGRDVFAPAAAALWSGAALADLGPVVAPRSLVRLPAPRCDVAPIGGGRMAATVEVLWVDRFGNVQLSAAANQVPLGSADVRVVLRGRPGSSAGSRPRREDAGRSGQPARRVRAFADLHLGELGVLEDANGYLAVVLREDAAGAALGLQMGDELQLTWEAAAP